MCVCHKTMHKSAALLLVGEATVDLYDLTVAYLATQLHGLNYSVEKTTVVASEEAVLALEIEASIKQYDIVVLVGGIGAAPSLGTALAKVFHQKLTTRQDLKGASIPTHAKVLEYSMFNSSNNVPVVCPVIYVQGLLLIPNDPESLKASFAHIVVPFLRGLSRRPVLKRTVLLRCGQNNNFLEKIPRRGDVDVSYVVGGDTKVTLTSSNLPGLLECEQSLKESYGDCLVRCYEGNDIPKLVYGQSCYSHVRYSIECIEECFAKYGPENVFLSFNGGKDCTVLLHLTLGVLKRHYPAQADKLFCLYVQSSNAFPELNDFVSQLRRYYDLNMTSLTEGIKESLAFILKSKPHMRACLMGSRRTDPYCGHLQSFQMTDRNWPQVMRVSPLLEWHYSEVWDYLLQLGVPYCSLYDMGYTSLGSVTNTVKNPALLAKGDLKNGQVYLPAYKLLDAAEERSGRVQT